MIKGDKVTFKCPSCTEEFMGNSAEIAVWAWEHYEEKHKNV